MPTRSSSARAVFSASAADRPFTFCGASMMFSSAVMCGKRLNDWNTIPTRVRSVGRFTPRRVIESPSTRMSPCWTRSRPLTQRISVDLPEPDGPQTTTTSPGVHREVDLAQDVELAEPLVDAVELDRRRHAIR